jgi:hypothetical protein
MAKFTRAEVRNILGEAHTEDLENRLIALHLGVVDPLKDQLQTYKTDAEKLPAVQKELDDIKAGDGDYKAKYEAEVKAHKEYRQQVESEKENARNDADVLAICKEAGIVRESSLRLIAKDFDRSKIERDKDGNITNRAKLLESVKADYADFVGTPSSQGTPPATPPTGGAGTGKTKEEILAIKDPAQRQAEMAKNLSLFGIE